MHPCFLSLLRPSKMPYEHPQTTPLQTHERRHRTRYYAHRVRETLTSRIAKIICSIFLTLLLVAGIITFILWISLRPHRPRFYVTSFSIPGLAQSAGVQNSDVTFEVSDRNPNRKIGIFYEDAMVGSLFYDDRQIGMTPSLLPPFYQPEKNTTVIRGVFSGTPLNVTDAGGGRVGFRLELTATIRFRVSTWDTHRHVMHVQCDVEVGPDGGLLAESKDQRCRMYFD